MTNMKGEKTPQFYNQSLQSIFPGVKKVMLTEFWIVKTTFLPVHCEKNELNGDNK